MRVILQTNVEQSVVISYELIMSVTVTYLNSNDFTVLDVLTLYCPLLQLYISRGPRDIVQ